MKDYTAGTTNATNTVTATPAASTATVEIEVNGNSHANGTPATWQAGGNTVVIVTADGGAADIYTVTVTKT